MLRAGLMLVVLGLLVPISGVAQSSIADRPAFDLRGVVLDASTEGPVSGANVTVPELGLSAITDESGEFVITRMPEGRFTFVTTALGYFENAEPSVVSDGYALFVRVAASPLALEGLDVTVTDEFTASLLVLDRHFEQRRNQAAVQSHAATREQLVLTSASSAADMLIDNNGVRFEPCPGQTTGDPACIQVRGRPLRVTVFVDGVPMTSPLMVLRSFGPQDLYRVEYYPPLGQVHLITMRFALHMASTGAFQLPMCVVC